MVSKSFWNKYSYFLNAVHYCMWRSEIKQQNFVNKTVTHIISFLVKIFTTKNYQEKFFTRQAVGLKKYDEWRINKKTGLHIAEANHWFGYLYSCYPGYISFILLALTMRYIHDMYFVILLVVALPIGIFYIPAYKAVFYKDRYLEYFKKFEKEDERWHKKWSRITTTFCIGAILMSLLGLASMFFICIYFDL